MAGATTIVGGETLRGGLAELQAVAEQIFGRHHRRRDWFTRKLAREGVEPELCAVAREHDTLLGYALLGRLPSRPGRARGAGVGVISSARGRGLGRALLEFACERAASSGCDTAEFLAEPAQLAWYEAAGFAAVHGEVCLAAPGLGTTPKLAELVCPPPPLSRDPIWDWAPEIWSRTASSQRLVVGEAGARLWLTREGHAWLVMRAEAEHERALLGALDSLRQHLPAATPVLLYPLTAAQPLLATLRAAGFAAIQHSFVVRRPTRLTGCD